MEWRGEAEAILAKMEPLSPIERGMLLGELRSSIRAALAAQGRRVLEAPRARATGQVAQERADRSAMANIAAKRLRAAPRRRPVKPIGAEPSEGAKVFRLPLSKTDRR